MRSWRIILASAMAAAVAGALLFRPGELPSRAGLAAFLLADWSAIAIVWLAVYGVAALGLTTLAVFGEIGNGAPGPVGHDWAWRYFVRLAVSQYFTALMALLALGASGVPVEPVPFQLLPAPFAARPAFAAAGGVIAVGLLGWLSLTVATLFRRRALSPAMVESRESRLLREAIELLRARAAAPAAATAEPGQLTQLIEQAQRPVLEVVKDLATAVNRLNHGLRRELEDIKGALRERAVETGSDSATVMESAAAELRAAAAALDAALARLGELGETPPAASREAPALPGAQSALSRQLQELLRDMAPSVRRDAPPR